jgi:hypothetical protein|tara:strand:+ start:580 stop:753 length:174 start_codon:yes stop_codon:yes gene_type:complete
MRKELKNYPEGIEDDDITTFTLTSLRAARQMADVARFEQLVERIDEAIEVIMKHHIV